MNNKINKSNSSKNEKKIMKVEENDRQSNNELILEKWSKLQKIIKEEMILKKVIIEQQQLDFSKLKKNFTEYYSIKLKIRETYEEIEALKISNINNKQIILESNILSTSPSFK